MGDGQTNQRLLVAKTAAASFSPPAHLGRGSHSAGVVFDHCWGPTGDGLSLRGWCTQYCTQGLSSSRWRSVSVCVCVMRGWANSPHCWLCVSVESLPHALSLCSGRKMGSRGRGFILGCCVLLAITWGPVLSLVPRAQEEQPEWEETEELASPLGHLKG